jgi:hypothetical protein
MTEVLPQDTTLFSSKNSNDTNDDNALFYHNNASEMAQNTVASSLMGGVMPSDETRGSVAHQVLSLEEQDGSGLPTQQPKVRLYISTHTQYGSQSTFRRSGDVRSP